MCQAKVNVVTGEYIDLKIVPSSSLYMTNCSTANLLLFFNNEHLKNIVKNYMLEKPDPILQIFRASVILKMTWNKIYLQFSFDFENVKTLCDF